MKKKTLAENYKRFFGEFTHLDGYGRKILKEYLVRDGDPLDEILQLNLFSDMAEGQLMSEYETEFGESEEWLAVEKKYTPIANKLEAIIQKNSSNLLTDDDVEIIDSIWYDGSDAYGDVDTALEFLPDLYNKQIKGIRDILMYHGIKY